MPLDLRPYDSLRINQKGIFIVAAGGYCQQFGGHFIARILALLLLLASRRRCSLFSQLFVLWLLCRLVLIQLNAHARTRFMQMQ